MAEAIVALAVDSGIYRVAMRHELQPEALKDAAPRYVLKEPIAVGIETADAVTPLPKHI